MYSLYVHMYGTAWYWDCKRLGAWLPEPWIQQVGWPEVRQIQRKHWYPEAGTVPSTGDSVRTHGMGPCGPWWTVTMSWREDDQALSQWVGGSSRVQRLQGAVTARDVVAVLAQEFPWSWLASFSKWFVMGNVEEFLGVVIGMNGSSFSHQMLSWMNSLPAFHRAILWAPAWVRLRTKRYRDSSCHWRVVAELNRCLLTYIIIDFRAVTWTEMSKLGLYGLCLLTVSICSGEYILKKS